MKHVALHFYNVLYLFTEGLLVSQLSYFDINLAAQTQLVGLLLVLLSHFTHINSISSNQFELCVGVQIIW